MTVLVEETLKEYCGQRGGSLSFEEDLSGHNTISVGGDAFAWYIPNSLRELRESISFLREANARIVMVGSGSNILMPDDFLDAVLINLSSDAFNFTEIRGRSVEVGAGTRLNSLIAACMRHGLSGLEGLVGIPGTVGGALMGNAGYITSISDRLTRVRMLDRNGDVITKNASDLSFGYRKSSFQKDEIIIGAVFELEKDNTEKVRKRIKNNFIKKMVSQPLGEKTLGSVFKNPEGIHMKSAQMIEEAGLKGKSCGGAEVSGKHANFIINRGNATARDVKALIRAVQDKVNDEFSIELVPEIIILEDEE